MATVQTYGTQCDMSVSVYNVCLQSDQETDVSMTADIYHFFVFRIVKVLATRYFEVLCLLLTTIIALRYTILKAILLV